MVWDLNIKEKDKPQISSSKDMDGLEHCSHIKKIIITDVSHSGNGSYGNFYVSGITADAHQIRPIIYPYNALRENNLRDKNGHYVMRPFYMVELNFIRSQYVNPHTENYLINPCFKPVFVRKLDFEESELLLKTILDPDVKSIFGTEIIDKRSTKKHCGNRSIGTVKLNKIHDITYSYKKFRLIFSDEADDKYKLPVTDWCFRNFYQKSGLTSSEFITKLKSFFSETDTYLRFGLSESNQDYNEQFLLITGIYSFPDYKNDI